MGRQSHHPGLDHYWVVDPNTPQVAVSRRTGDDLALITHVAGNDRLNVTEPFAVSFVPADLLGQ